MSVNIKNWQELKKPNSLDVKSGGDAKRKATFVAEPLERGFGLTLGNALRRVLLSSLQGAAITSIKIENVLHEFSVARRRARGRDRHRPQREADRAQDGRRRPQAAAAFGDRPGRSHRRRHRGVAATSRCMNKDLVICHLDEGATLNMELTADTGKGYVPAVSATARSTRRSA